MEIKNNKCPLITVPMITFAHEEFIIDAIRGVLKQNYPGCIELIIADDHSPDNTEVVVKKFISENSIPDNIVIKYVRHNKNKGMVSNFYWSIEQANGKYIALCEGDDFWTDTDKLSKQVDFLENNLDYNICFHDIAVLKDGKLVSDGTFDPQNFDFSIEELALNNFMHTPTVVYRNFFNFPEWMKRCAVGDYPLHIFNATNGKIKRIAQQMAVYRVHDDSSWSSINDIMQLVKWFQVLDNILSNQYLNKVAKANLILQLRERFLYFRILCIENAEKEIYLATLKPLLKKYPDFFDLWYDDFYSKDFDIILSKPNGIKKSFTYLVKQVQQKLMN